MRSAEVLVQNQLAGVLSEENDGTYSFTYQESYVGPPVSLTMPVGRKIHSFKNFPPFFDGLLPEGGQLEALLRREKLDRDDYLGQLITVGADLVGAATVRKSE
jgi:serine/threonine-protein kinase HipA